MSTQEVPEPEPSSEKLHIPGWLTAVLLIVAFALIHVALPWGISLLAPRYGWADGMPGTWNMLALIIVAAGVAGTLWMIALHFAASPRTFLDLQQTPTLLRRGPYARSRNPMYLSELTFWTGWTLFYGSAAVLIGTLLFFALLNFAIVPFEERRLEARFGDAYRQYLRAVPRWLGMLRG